jgi:hypothetical protein
MLNTSSRSQAREAAEDVFFGQIALIWARWFLIAAGAIIALWSADSIAQITVSILVVIMFMAINFFMHGRYILEKPSNKLLLLVTNVIDISIITFLVVAWPGKQGLDSQFFVLYYPLLFAFALVFEPKLSIAFSLITLGLYTLASAGLNPLGLLKISNFEILAARLITMGAMSGLGTFYYRRQREALRSLTQATAPRRIP